MQQVLSQAQASAGAEVQLLPFSFGMSQTEGAEFYEMLKQTISDLEQDSLNNKEIAEQLDFIKQNIPSDLMAKIEKDLELEKESTKEDELSATAFAVLNLIDNIIENIENIETKPDLEESMADKGISQNNISTAMQLIDTPSLKNTELKAEGIKTTDNVSINAKLKQSYAPSQFLSEDIITGKEITTEKMQESVNFQKEIDLANTQEPANTTSAENTNKDAKFNEILKLFKEIKDSANKEGLTLNIPEKKATTVTTADVEAKQIAEIQKTNEVKTISPQESSKIVQHNTNDMLNNKTNAEINKSEYKELASKFISEMANDSVKSTEEIKPTNHTIATNFNTKTNTHKTEINTQVNNIDVVDFENITNNIEQNETTQEAKPLTSNFNMQLYKIAQQANIQNQINVAIKNLNTGNKQIKVKLNPEELGSVTIEMEMVDNMAKGVITVEKPEVAQQLAQNLNKMLEGFKQAGYNLNTNDIIVKVDEHSQKEQNQFKQSNNEDEESKEINLTITEEELNIEV